MTQASVDFVTRIIPPTQTDFGVYAVPPTLILDRLGVLAVRAFSTRRLSVNYHGPAMKVRRSSDNATQDIGFVAGNLDVGSLLAFVAGGSGFVDTWYDQSLNHVNVTAPAIIQQPRIVNAGVLETSFEGTVGIYFGVATNTVLFSTGDVYSFSEHYAVLTSRDTYPHSRYQGFLNSKVDQDVNGDGAIADLDFKIQWYPNNTLDSDNQTLQAQTPVADPDAFYNNTIFQHWHVTHLQPLAGLGTMVGNDNSNTPNVQATANNNSWIGLVSEGIMFPTALSPSDRATLYANQKFQFGIVDTYLGDQIGVTPTLLLSTRRLRNDYRGPCINVRRSSDNTTQDIGFTAGGNLDTAALTTFVGAASGFVTKWYDQSSLALHPAQATAGNQPRIVNAGVIETLNSLPVICFIPGSSTFLQTPNYPVNNLYGEIFVTCAMPGIAFDLGGAGPMILAQTGSAFLFGDAGNVIFDGLDSWSVNNVSTRNAIFGSTLQQVNTYFAGATNAGGSQLAAGGAFIGGGQPAFYAPWDGWIGEIVVFAQYFGNYPTERAFVYNNQKTHWGTP